MEHELRFAPMRVLIKMIDPLGVERGRPALQPMYHIALGDQQFCQIRAVLPRCARDQGGSSHGMVPFSGALASRDRLPQPVDCLPPVQRRMSAVAGFGDDA